MDPPYEVCEGLRNTSRSTMMTGHVLHEHSLKRRRLCLSEFDMTSVFGWHPGYIVPGLEPP